MTFCYPEFSTPIALDDDRAWTATYDSYDQRNDDVYYRITIGETSFMAQVGLYWAGEDWTTPEFRARLQDELHRVAARGVTNTTYTGAMVPQR
ncbi:MAG: hypothetical protein R3B48_16270 [Kofleriaceae bacterium]